MSGKPKQRETEPNFEGAMDRLEKIVEQMESGKLPLEDLIVRYEEGMNLVKDFESTPEPATPRSVVDEPQNTNEEIRLF